MLVRAAVDHVVLTGDVTHHGRNAELDTFHRIFRPLLANARLTVVPGNHDRTGEDAGARLMHGERVAIHETDGLYLVRVDSTAPHNRSAIASHGDLCNRVIADAALALSAAPAGSLKVLALHHHVVPLPEEGFLERLSTLVGLPHARELRLGSQLLRLVEGRCDLVLHGHRHVPRSFTVAGQGGGSLLVSNAGCSTELMKARLYTHAEGRLVSPPRWLSVLESGSPAPLGSSRRHAPGARYPLAPPPPRAPESARLHGAL